MRILCKIFGHAAQLSGWFGDGLYGKVVPVTVDGIGREHFKIVFTCPRCKSEYISARFSTQADSEARS